jgi:hypothetical protein
MHDLLDNIKYLFSRDDDKAKFLGRQLMFLNSPLSRVVELYLNDNEGQLQKLDQFPMMREIYNKLPQKLLLKCSRKTLKSTLLSNIVALNMVRYNYYKMLYVAPQEISTKYFSQNYLSARFESPALKKILPGFIKNDVFEKILDVTNSGVILRYAKDDATRCRGPATDHNIYDEVQDTNKDVIPIIQETMAISPFKREMYAGTPLTTDNTIHQLWKQSTQFEWATKCEGCNHWNTLTVDNEPLKMIRLEGLSCSKCSRRIDTTKGLWTTFSSDKSQLVGYHLAQPILPYFNQKPKEWKEIYNKVTNKNYSTGQVYNEVFGIAYDTGAKPITEEFLKTRCCVLGNLNKDENHPTDIWDRANGKYKVRTCGADWGVNMDTSRTTVCLGGLRDDNVFEVFFCKVYRDFDYEWQIKDIARRANAVDAFCASDSGPDPNRGIKLVQYTSPSRSQLVRYEHGKFIQRYEIPSGSIDWRQNRWCLHRSDTMTFVFNLIKQGKILFPQWEDCSEEMQDILNIFIEVKEGNFGRQDLFYRHKPDQPDDFFHALNFAVCQAYMVIGDAVLSGPSSSAEDLPTAYA